VDRSTLETVHHSKSKGVSVIMSSHSLKFSEMISTKKILLLYDCVSYVQVESLGTGSSILHARNDIVPSSSYRCCVSIQRACVEIKKFVPRFVYICNKIGMFF
jgi:hypothetical protein